jgi:hypothetical protein
MEKSKFSIESLPGQIFEGFTTGEDWNGWACPYFAFEEACRIVEAHNKSNELPAVYDENKDTFIFEFPDEPEEYTAEQINGQKLYGIGTGGWIWESV